MKKRTNLFAWTCQTALISLALGIGVAGCGGGDSVPIGATTTPVVTTGNLKPPFLGKIAFLSSRGANEVSKLYVMNQDGSQVTQVNPLPEFATFNLLYPYNHYMSADGTTFLFTFDQGTGAGTNNIYVKTDGTGEKNVTNLLDPTATGSGNGVIGQVSDVTMNANGTRFVFVARDRSLVSNTLVAENADGTARTTLYTDPSITGTSVSLASPIFAPDGQTIYFVRSLENNTNAAIGDIPAGTLVNRIYRLAAGATTPTLVASLPPLGTVYLPGLGSGTLSVSSDGTKLVYSTEAQASSQIYTVNTDGTGLTALTSDKFNNVNASFTTDGTKIIFVSDRDGNQEIYSMNPNGSSITRLTFEIEPDNTAATRSKNGSTVQKTLRSIVR